MTTNEILISDTPVPIKTFCAKFDWPSESAMRAYRLRANALGLGPAFISVSRRVLVKPKTFFNLLESENNRRVR